ncbi:hypothetical protein L6164_033586 [Bauhinia variegata]|uniref:Uncharacterized protein n=1 Tax=Bauhinia variegata TaxID=167791 RepID=A0ACB9KSC5_BAUVA|nr:hypothetical protein L6164_033586 [Bauhinia variegata]
MATKGSWVHVDEDYIDMELSSSPNLFSCTTNSPQQSREFEFQMNSISNEKEPTTSPADELFYKGKLLPLHLPPRLQMVQKLVENNSNATTDFVKTASNLEDSSFPFITDLSSTPMESSNISQSESCRVSSELINPDEFLFGWSSDINGIVGDLPKKSWSKKLKQIKQYWLGQRFKSSRAYLKSLFCKSNCSDKSCASAANNVGAEKKSKCKNCQNKYMRVARKSPYEIADNKRQISSAVMKTISREMLEDGFNNHRRSFSGVIQRHSPTKSSSLSASSSGSSSSSSSFSFSSSGYYDLQLFKRSITVNSEVENSIQGAIAHCKQSQQQFSSRKILDEARVFPQPTSKCAVYGNQETPVLGST